MNYRLLQLAIEYVMGDPYFWGSMGFTVAIAMFAGVLIYDGELNQVKRGFVSVISYACMLFMVNAFRINGTLNSINLSDLSGKPYYAYASLVSLITTTIFWLVGLCMGVALFHYKYRKPVDEL